MILFSGRIRKCLRERMTALDERPPPGYMPQCDKAGYYEPEQCATDKSKWTFNTSAAQGRGANATLVIMAISSFMLCADE